VFAADRQFGRALGPWNISRRDMLNGIVLSAGAGLVCNSCLAHSVGAQATSAVCDGVIGHDTRALRGGNLPSTFKIAHWLRDRRLRFDRNRVTLSPGCDGLEGTFPISEETRFDVIIVGAGLAGLSAAFAVLRKRSKARILLLEANPTIGGNAGRDYEVPLPVIAPTAGAYCCKPSSPLFRALFRELGIDSENRSIADPGDCYFFDEYTPGVRPGYRGWNIDTLGRGMKGVPYETTVLQDLLRSRSNLLAFAKLKDGFDDPPDRSSEQFDSLSRLRFDEYLTQFLQCDPIISDFYSLYTVDSLGGTTQQVNAHSAISFLGGEFGDDLIAFAGGTSEVATRLLRWLTAPAGRPHSTPQIEVRSVALRIDAEQAGSAANANVTYYKDGIFRRANANAVIVAAQSQAAHVLVNHLLDDRTRSAWEQFNTVPVVTANVALRTAAPLVELGLGYSQAWWGSRHWANFCVADWINDRRHDPERPTVLTFYGANRAPPEELPNERMKLLQTPFADYERSLKDDLSRILRASHFDFDRDVSAIFVYRWGHSMIMPVPNWLFGTTKKPNGRLDRNKAPRRVACRPLGPILFAGQHTEGTPSAESAIVSGYRAAHQALNRL
jgi:spermidine dehydrogenase